ncbi:MAG: hypothetical protein GVY20_01120 [Bacteroidetes bacterium]|jgi:hypothetical protein|nr:hypothetical protein [Bacteroidota bacterium]
MDIEKRLRLLSIYSVFSSIIILILLFSVIWIIADKSPIDSENYFQSADSLHIPYLTAERVDIIEPDGQLAIALSNSKTSAKLRFDGQILQGASNRDIPNIIFFDGKGDEVGGLAFANFKDEDAPITAIRHLAFDGFRQDEVITMSHFVQNGKSRKGVYIYDRPDIPIMDALGESGVNPEDTPGILGEKLSQFREGNPERHEELWGNPRRVAVQTNEENEAELLLGDAEGNIRLRFVVTPEGDAYVDFLDENGNSVKRLEP